MSIESPRIAGKPVAHRTETPINCVPLTVPGPSNVHLQHPYLVFDTSINNYREASVFEFVTPVGLLVFSKRNEDTAGKLYVIIFDTTEGIEKMVPVVSSVVFDANMAKVFDPLAGFYDPLAS